MEEIKIKITEGTGGDSQNSCGGKIRREKIIGEKV